MECTLSYLVQYSTHLAMLPGVYVVWRMREGAMLGCGLATLVTSLLYHLCEVMNNAHCFGGRGPHHTLLWMNEGKWHRLDNVFAIASLQHLCLYVSVPHRTLRDTLAWVALGLTLACQEYSPWDLRMTLGPLLPFVTLAVVGLAVRRGPLRRGWLVGAALAAVPAAYGFAKGLDDERDYLRLHHGLWHVAVNAAASCLALATYHVPKVAKTL